MWGQAQGVCTACVEYVRVDPTAGNVTLYREAIEYVDNFRYLGVQLAADNRDTKDFDDRAEKSQGTLWGAPAAAFESAGHRTETEAATV